MINRQCHEKKTISVCRHCLLATCNLLKFSKLVTGKGEKVIAFPSPHFDVKRSFETGDEGHILNRLNSFEYDQQFRSSH